MPKGYVVITEAIHDAAGMRAYGKASAASFAEHHVSVLAASEDVRVVEGEWQGNRTILLEFESVEAAGAWYESDVYQAAKSLREAAAESNVVMLPGFEFPSR